MLPLDALDEFLVELGGEFVRDVEGLLDRHPQLVVHLVQQTRVAVLAGVPLIRSRSHKCRSEKCNPVITFGMPLSQITTLTYPLRNPQKDPSWPTSANAVYFLFGADYSAELSRIPQPFLPVSAQAG